MFHVRGGNLLQLFSSATQIVKSTCHSQNANCMLPVTKISQSRHLVDSAFLVYRHFLIYLFTSLHLPTTTPIFFKHLWGKSIVTFSAFFFFLPSILGNYFCSQPLPGDLCRCSNEVSCKVKEITSLHRLPVWHTKRKAVNNRL